MYYPSFHFYTPNLCLNKCPFAMFGMFSNANTPLRHREYFANRAAALQIKARVQKQERGNGGGVRTGGPSAAVRRNDYDSVAGMFIFAKLLCVQLTDC